MAATRVQAVAKSNGATTNAIAIGAGDGLSAPKAGNLLVVFVSQHRAVALMTAGSFTDNLASVYTLALSDTPGVQSQAQAIAYLPNCPSGITSITVTPGTFASAVVVEYSGCILASPLDQVAPDSNPTAGVTTFNSDTVVTTATDVVIGFATNSQTSNRSFAPGVGWSLLIDSPNTGDGDESWLEERINVALGSYVADGTCVASTVGSSIIAFKVNTDILLPMSSTEALRT